MISSPNQMVATQLMRINPIGFELICPGLWLGEDRAAPTLTFRFEMSMHSEEIPYRWMKYLQTFKRTKYDREYTAIFDRIPLDRVIPDMLGLIFSLMPLK